MARALVVYESIFGDARTIAEAVADGLRTHFAEQLSSSAR
jgi:flavodoxin